MVSMTEAAPPFLDVANRPVSVLAGWPVADSAVAGAEQSVDDVRALLQLARGMADAGRRVDLGGLDGLLGRLCARSLDLMPDDGRRLVPLLAALLTEIDALRCALTRASAPP